MLVDEPANVQINNGTAVFFESSVALFANFHQTWNVAEHPKHETKEENGPNGHGMKHKRQDHREPNVRCSDLLDILNDII